MIRSELLQALGKDNPELRAEDVERAVDTFFEEITQRLADGGRVELRGFGAFSTRHREGRQGRASRDLPDRAGLAVRAWRNGRRRGLKIP